MTRKRRKIIAVNKIFVIFAHVGHWLKAIAVNVRGSARPCMACRG